MKNFATKNIASLLMMATVVAAPAAAYGQATTTITGNSGGTEASGDCGFISGAPAYSFNISGSMASVSIEVSGADDYTLLMISPDNSSRECILAHDFDGGAIQSRGLFKSGTYHLYVGDLDGVGAPFTMTVQQ